MKKATPSGTDEGKQGHSTERIALRPGSLTPAASLPTSDVAALPAAETTETTDGAEAQSFSARDRDSKRAARDRKRPPRSSLETSEDIHPGAVAVQGVASRPSESLENAPQEEDDATDAVQQTVNSAETEHTEGAATSISVVSTSELVHAELVPPMVQAVTVHIDEEDGTHSPSLAKSHAKEEQESDTSNPSWIYKAIISILVAVIVVVVAVFIVRNNRDKPKEVDPPRYDYDCYSSTLDLIVAQMQMFYQTNTTEDVYIMCPNTWIEVGILESPALGEYEFIGGDYPLWVIGPNTVLQCGLDGRVENNCVIDGGFLQVLIQPDVPLPDDYLDEYDYVMATDIFLDNVTIQGFTFTGAVDSAPPLLGSSVSINQHGNFVMEDCRWTGMVATYGMFGVGTNSYQQSRDYFVPEQSVSFTLRNCQLDNIVYDTPFMITGDQTIAIENSTFSNISVSDIAADNCVYMDVYGETTHLEGGCASLMTCFSRSFCSISNSCFTNMETHAAGMVMVENAENFTGLSGTSIENVEYVGPIDNYLGENSTILCEVYVFDLGGNGSACLNDLVFQADSCGMP
eukprot:Nitzschia sp. Nitz4//scaffold190_size42200//19354//21069//NITZ4_007391-RA/size42200-processed-gene-0.61-mRNA-1//1//CDS//3329540141//9224//frame0